MTISQQDKIVTLAATASKLGYDEAMVARIVAAAAGVNAGGDAGSDTKLDIHSLRADAVSTPIAALNAAREKGDLGRIGQIESILAHAAHYGVHINKSEKISVVELDKAMKNSTVLANMPDETQIRKRLELKTALYRCGLIP
jgi:hypothetical protein